MGLAWNKEPRSLNDTPPKAELWGTTGQRLVALAFFLLHSAAVIDRARPANLLYPAPPGDSGWTWLADVEKATQSNLLETMAHPRGPVALYSRYFGIDQQWNTFAPSPPALYAHYTVDAQSARGTQKVWDDGMPLDRSGAGFYYDPTVKLVSIFRQRSKTLSDLFLAYQARHFQSVTGTMPSAVSLQAAYVAMRISSEGRVTRSEVQELTVGSLQVTR